MPTSTATLVTTVTPMAGGVTQVDARGPQYRLTFSGTWAVGDTWTLEITSTFGDFTLGYGNISGITPTYGKAIKNRVYLAISSRFAFSALDDSTGWEQQNAGSGSIDYNSNLYGADLVQSFAIYQGKLAVFARRSIQIWNIDSDPDLFALLQSLENIGTVAPDSVQPLGELEIFFLSDTGVRSLRARETSLNAFVNDLGSPIDALLIAAMQPLTDAQKATATSVVDPNANRYWLYLNGTIYNLSYFPSSKIIAWGQYTPQYASTVTVTISAVSGLPNVALVGYRNNGLGSIGAGAASDATTLATNIKTSADLDSGTTGYTTARTGAVLTFTPPNGIPNTAGLLQVFPSGTVTVTVTNNWTALTFLKLFTHGGQVYARTATQIVRYGWTDNNLYDGSAVIAELPWLDKDKPSQLKQGKSIDMAITGKWAIQAGQDPYSGTLEDVATTGDATAPDQNKDSTFDLGMIPYTSNGTHFKLKATSSELNNAKVLLSCLTYQFTEGQED